MSAKSRVMCIRHYVTSSAAGWATHMTSSSFVPCCCSYAIKQCDVAALPLGRLPGAGAEGCTSYVILAATAAAPGLAAAAAADCAAAGRQARPSAGVAVRPAV